MTQNKKAFEVTEDPSLYGDSSIDSLNAAFNDKPHLSNLANPNPGAFEEMLTSPSARLAAIKEVPMKTAQNVEAQVKAAAPELTKLAKHRVALAYALASGNKTASTTTARRRMVEAFLTMPTFALQSLYDMHSAADHTADDMPKPEDDSELPPEGDAPPVEGEEVPAEGGDLGGDLGGMDMGMGGGMGAPADPNAGGDTQMSALKAENEALVGDIQKLEQDFAKLQETLPEGGALDLSSILSEDALDEKAEQLPAGGEGEDPALNFMPEDGEQSLNFMPEEEEGEQAHAAAVDSTDDVSFERELLGTLQGVDAGKSDPALPEQVGGVAGDQLAIFEQDDFSEADYADLPSNILGILAPPAGSGLGNPPAAPKAAATKKVASAGAGARFLPSGTLAPAKVDDQQVTRLASLLKSFGE